MDKTLYNIILKYKYKVIIKKRTLTVKLKEKKILSIFHARTFEVCSKYEFVVFLHHSHVKTLDNVNPKRCYII